MGYSEADLQRFESIVMKKATEQRVKILQEIEEQRKRMLEEKEMEFLEQAYMRIQKEIRNITRERNEMISNADMERKRTLLHKRNEIIDDLFANVESKVREYTLTPEYISLLLKSVKESIEAVGDGDKVIYISEKDAQHISKIREAVNNGESLDIQLIKEDIIGGCRVLNKTGNKFIDNSLSSKLMHEKEQFLKTSGLFIES